MTTAPRRHPDHSLQPRAAADALGRPLAGRELITMWPPTASTFTASTRGPRQCRPALISFQAGTAAAFDLLVLVPSSRTLSPLAGPGWISARGQSAAEYPGIFAIGDASASLPTPGGPCPRPRSSPRRCRGRRRERPALPGLDRPRRIRCPVRATAISTPGRMHPLRAKATLHPASPAIHLTAPSVNSTTTNGRRNGLARPLGTRRIGDPMTDVTTLTGDAGTPI